MARLSKKESTNKEGGNMRCQIPGCRNKGLKPTTKEGIFCGVHLENIVVYTCGRHSTAEVDQVLEQMGEERANSLQDTNPFAVPKMFKTA